MRTAFLVLLGLIFASVILMGIVGTIVFFRDQWRAYRAPKRLKRELSRRRDEPTIE